MFSVSLCVSFCVSFSTKGSIPEKDAGKLYNTCAVFGPDGTLLVKHRKVSRGCGNSHCLLRIRSEVPSTHPVVYTPGIGLVGTGGYTWLLAC